MCLIASSVDISCSCLKKKAVFVQLLNSKKVLNLRGKECGVMHVLCNTAEVLRHKRFCRHSRVREAQRKINKMPAKQVCFIYVG